MSIEMSVGGGTYKNSNVHVNERVKSERYKVKKIVYLALW